ncbi:MAG: Asp-tRNA(Asn)/Glu-tRNA(Gln) amidotransferase subunit GatB [Dehalococcoidales bacterium]|nr:MAG: Asp-tRNA(Asn)/Glu-tRNA(Gln) amidotransferase subunit GatB [Dehalococcoidales bacterium]
MDYETIIGLEVHAQLQTRSKMYCRCSADYAAAPPNTHVCPVCLGMPGVLPVINQQAIEYTIMTALALNCTVSDYTRFDRKNYPYPDLMKGYQISQSYVPVGYNGYLTIDINDKKKKVGIDNVHLEEDVARLVHRDRPGGEACSLVDVNRAGVPLMEIVGEPELRSPEEARQYLMELRSILQYLGVSTANMEEGSFRCDANISIRPEGISELSAKVEVKNMNSFRAVYRALEYEVRRQIKAAEEGKKLVQETRGWVEDSGVTVSQRSKEYAQDYRYFPEPDLPPLVISRDWVEEIKEKLPELPEARRQRLVTDYGLSIYDADLLTVSKTTADYFEECLVSPARDLSPREHAKQVANWIIGEFSHLLNVTNTDVADMVEKVSPGALCDLIQLVSRGDISGTGAKQVFEEMFNTGKAAGDIVREKGLSQISDAGELEATVSQVIAENPQALTDFKAGKEQALKFLVGQIMKATRGRANPQLVNQLLREKLEGE